MHLQCSTGALSQGVNFSPDLSGCLVDNLFLEDYKLQLSQKDCMAMAM